MSYFLSICIPTYNGGENLKYNVNKLIKMQPEFGFEVCVSDNASDEGTQEFMKDIIDKYDFVKYHRNEENFGFACNFDYVLKMANGEYRWLLGDDDEIIEENLGKIISTLKKYKPDICVVNGGTLNTKEKRVINIKTNVYVDKNRVVEDIGEQMSWISSLIFAKTVIQLLKMKKINNNAFPHLIESFKYIDCKCNIFWLDDICVKPQTMQQIRYDNKILEYFIKDWLNIFSFENSYSKYSKEIFLKAIIKRIFTNKSILVLRSRNIINKQNVYKVKEELKHYPLSFRFKINLIVYVPYKILDKFYNIYKLVKYYAKS